MLVLRDWLPKTVSRGAPVTAEQDSALLGRENFVGLFGTRLNALMEMAICVLPPN